MTAQVETWRLYRFDTAVRCRHGHAHRLYIGISNEPLRRVLEHAKDKPWFRHVTGWTVDERVFYAEADALEAERLAILAELPLANDQHNRGNPCRMVFHDGARPPRQVARRVRARRWTRGQVRVAGWAAGWTVAAAALTALAVHFADLSVVPATQVGAGGSTVAAAGVWFARLPRRRQQLVRRCAAGVVLVVVVACLLWQARMRGV